MQRNILLRISTANSCDAPAGRRIVAHEDRMLNKLVVDTVNLVQKSTKDPKQETNMDNKSPTQNKSPSDHMNKDHNKDYNGNEV